MDVTEIRNILGKFTNSKSKKRKRDVVVSNPLIQYVTALVQPHIIAKTTCNIPFDIITQHDNTTTYDVEGNPPITTLTVVTVKDIPISFVFD